MLTPYQNHSSIQQKVPFHISLLGLKDLCGAAKQALPTNSSNLLHARGFLEMFELLRKLEYLCRTAPKSSLVGMYRGRKLTITQGKTTEHVQCMSSMKKT